MAQVSPPKPWERAGAAQTSLPPSLPTSSPATTMTMTAPSTSSTPTTSTTSTTSQPPSIPQRPASLTNPALARPQYGGMNQLGSYGGGYGMGGMGGLGGMASPYSRYGMGGMGGMGMSGGMYGGMGGMGMGGGMYGGMPGMMGDPNDPNSLMRGMENSTATTFQMIESIVQAFGGFAQMLESTFMATHSSFFAMVRVAEQFGNLRSTLGSILGIFTVLRWVRTAFAKLTGRPMPVTATDLTPAHFAHFEGRGAAPSRPSKKPFFFFIMAVFGLPYLMGKLIRSLAAKQEEEQRRLAGEAPTLDPSQLEFCRVLYDFTPEQQGGVELEVKKGDLVAVLSKSDPMGNASQWWRCRARDSRVGYLPSPYLESIVRKEQGVTSGVKQIAADSRTSTMTKEIVNQMSGKAGDISIESFQKGQFNS